MPATAAENGDVPFPFTKPVRVETPVPPFGTVRGVESATVGLPETPSPFVTEMPVPAAIERCAQVFAAVRTAMPVEARPSSAARSFVSAKVGSPAMPAGFVIEKPAAGAWSVRPAKVSAAVWTRRPFVLNAASAASVASREMVGLPETPSPFVTVTCDAVPVIVRSAHVSVAVRAGMPVEARPSSAARSFASAKVGLPATPAGFVIDRPAAGAVSVRTDQASVPVRAPKPVPDRPSTAERSFVSAKVGSPAIPAGLVIEKPAAGAWSVRPVNVSAAVCVRRPFVLNAASETSVASSVTVGFPATPPASAIASPDPTAMVRCAQVFAAVRTAMPVEARPSSAARSFASAKVMSPAIPAGFVIVRPAAGATRERSAHVLSAVRTAIPVPLSAAMAVRSGSRLTVTRLTMCWPSKKPRTPWREPGQRSFRLRLACRPDPAIEFGSSGPSKFGP